VPAPKLWNQEYQRKCFDAWYLNGRPNLPARIREIIPPDRDGRKPGMKVIRSWVNGGSWDMMADELDVKVEEQANLSLINAKAEMLRRHQVDAIKLADKAREYLLKEGFDSASSASQTYFRATEEQRKTAGFSDLLERLDKMTNNEVEREIIALLNRGSENEQIIDSETSDITPESESQDSQQSDH
jgi:hypothetical protein